VKKTPFAAARSSWFRPANTGLTLFLVLLDHPDQVAFCLNSVRRLASESENPPSIAIMVYDESIEWISFSDDGCLRSISLSHSEELDIFYLPLQASQLFTRADRISEDQLTQLKTRLAARSAKLKRSSFPRSLNQALRYVARCLAGVRAVALHHSLDGVVARNAQSSRETTLPQDAKTNQNPQTLFKCQVNFCDENKEYMNLGVRV